MSSSFLRILKRAFIAEGIVILLIITIFSIVDAPEIIGAFFGAAGGSLAAIYALWE